MQLRVPPGRLYRAALLYLFIMNKNNASRNSILARAYLRDGDILIIGEALLIAALLHSHGSDRSGEDFKDVQKIMLDRNLNED